MFNQKRTELKKLSSLNILSSWRFLGQF